MAEHYFSTREELHSFWKRGRGNLLNNYKNCLHETGCHTYRANPPGLGRPAQIGHLGEFFGSHVFE